MNYLEGGAEDSKGKEESKKEEAGAKKDPVVESKQSDMTSSLMETSEDEREKKAKEAEKAKKAAKKGLSEKQLNEEVCIELSETDTMTLLLIPGVFVSGEKEEEYALTEKHNKIYKELCDKKISSDAFIDRGSQTMNLTQKTREYSFEGYKPASKEVQATHWDIMDASLQKVVSKVEKDRQEYNNQI